MNNYEATEIAYKNGYEAGKRDAVAECQSCAKATKEVIESLQRKLVTDNNVAYKMKATEARFLLKENGEIIPLTNGQQWIPVSERLPKREDANLYESVLAINKEDGVPRSWIWDIVVDYPKEFTHWMPLPEPPKGE